MLPNEINRFIRAVLEPMGLELTHEKCARCDRRAVRIATSDDAFTGSGLCVPCTRQSLIDMGRKIRRQRDRVNRKWECSECGHESADVRMLITALSQLLCQATLTSDFIESDGGTLHDACGQATDTLAVFIHRERH